MVAISSRALFDLERTLDDVFAVQSEIAASVADALQITLLGDPLYLRQTSPEAYSLYLKARYFDNLKGPENWEKAISHYQQALEIDPEYALCIFRLWSARTVLPRC